MKKIFTFLTAILLSASMGVVYAANVNVTLAVSTIGGSGGGSVTGTYYSGRNTKANFSNSITTSQTKSHYSGKTVTMTATANTGYRFVVWRDNNGNEYTGTSMSGTVSSATTYTAYFIRDPYTFDWATQMLACECKDANVASGVDMWKVQMSIDGTANAPILQLMIPTPHGGYNYGNVYGPAPGTYTGATGTSYASYSGSKWVCNSAYSSFFAPVTLAAAYLFSSGEVIVEQGTNGYPHIKVNGVLTNNNAYYSIYVECGSKLVSAGTITATPNNAQYGSVAGTAGASTFVSGTNYAANTSITLTATPNTGYYFNGWSDSNNENPRSFTVDGNKSITANFVAYGNGGSLGTKTWSCNNSSATQSNVLQTIGGTTDIYNNYFTSNGYNPAIQFEFLIPTGTRKCYYGYYGAPAGTYNVWYDNSAGAAQVPSHSGECLGSVQDGAVVSRYYDNSGNPYIFYSGTVTVEPGVSGLYYKFVGKVLRNNNLYDLTAIVGTRNTAATEIGQNYTITDCLVKRTSTNNCFDIVIYGNHPYSGSEGGVIQLKNVNLGSNTSIAGAHTFTASYSNCDNSGQWFAEDGYTNSNGADYIDNPSGTITFTWVGTDGSGNPRYTIDISSCHGYYYNSSVVSGGYCFNTRNEINQYGYTFSKTMSVRAQNSDGSALTLTDAPAPTTYSLTWDPGAGELVGTPGVDYTANGEYEAGTTLVVPNATLAGYHLTEWEEESTGDMQFFGEGEPKTDQDEYYNANWAPNDYTVTFNGNGSTSGNMSNQTGFKYGTSKALTSNAFSRVYTVTYNYHDATGGNGTASANATYTFNGWNTNQDGTSGTDYTNGQSISTPTPAPAHNGTLNLYAKWNSASVTLPTPTKTGHRFNGWYTDATGGTRVGGAGDSYTPTAGITLHAQWTELVTFTIASYSNGTVTVSYTDNGAQAFTSGSRDIPVGTLVSFSAVANTNYHITNVDLSGSSFSASSAYTLQAGDGTKTLTANFLPDTYAITYNKGANGTGSIDAGEKTYGVNFTLSSSTFSREGYTQTGWSLTDGGNKAYELGGSYTTNSAQEFFPFWTVNQHNISWVTDGNALTGDYTHGTTDYGTTIVAPNTPTKNATEEYTYAFDAWSPTPAATMPDNDVEYTATFTATPVEYTITFHSNGGSIPMNLVYTVEDEDIELPTAEEMTKDNHTFAGWYNNAELEGDAVTVVAAGSTGNKEFWAKWTLNGYVITFMDYDGETTLQSTAVAQGTRPSITDPTRADDEVNNIAYSFIGWKSSADENVYATANLPVATAVVTYTAQYEPYFLLLDDKTDNNDAYYTALANKEGERLNVKYMRTFTAGRWATFSLPFGYSYRPEENTTFKGQVYYLISAKYTADGYLTLNCMPVTDGLVANKPYILIPSATIENPTFKNVKMKAVAPNYYTAPNTEGIGTGVTFRNTIERETLEKDKRVIYIKGANNQLYYPSMSVDTWMRPFRGYFYLNVTPEQIQYTPARVRLVTPDGEYIEQAPDTDQPAAVETKKYIENGILVIERAGMKYDAQGHIIK